MPDLLPITDTEIDEVIKVAPEGVPLDPTKTQGRNHRTLIKKIRDWFAQEIAKKFDKTGGILSYNFGRGNGFVGPYTSDLLHSSTFIVAGNATPHPTTADTWLVGTDGSNNGAQMLIFTVNSGLKFVSLPSTGGTIAEYTNAQLSALAVSFDPFSKADKTLVINTRPSTETAYNLQVSDLGGEVKTTTANPNTITILPTSSVPWPTGFQCVGRQGGAGQTTFIPGSGVTINSADGLKVVRQHGMWTLIHEGNNVWALGGALSA